MNFRFRFPVANKADTPANAAGNCFRRHTKPPASGPQRSAGPIGLRTLSRVSPPFSLLRAPPYAAPRKVHTSSRSRIASGLTAKASGIPWAPLLVPFCGNRVCLCRQSKALAKPAPPLPWGFPPAGVIESREGGKQLTQLPPLCFRALSIGTSRRDCVRFFVTGSMGREPNNHGPRSARAQLTRCATNAFPLRCGANHNFPPAWREAIGALARGQNASDRARFQFREAVRFRKGIGGEIDSEARRVRLPNGADVRGASVLVGISKPTLPAIGADQLAQFPAVNCFPDSGQVSRLVMAPKLPGRQSGYLRAKLSPRHPAFAVSDFPPVKSKRTAPGITSAAAIKRAGRRARFGGGSRNGNWACFGVPRYYGKMNLSLHGLNWFVTGL